MTEVHLLIGYSIPAGFALLFVLTVYAFVRDRPPGGLFWNLLAALQIVLGIQLVVGVVLFASGLRPRTQGPHWLHYVYGAVLPALVLVVAHRAAASERFRAIPWLAFGIAAFVCFASTFRALQTGLGA
ncbi:MAG: hypothetical protein M3198_07575 [Actinomycetota bacterium]|nr:hypothetical protein [Actinomycetota bacterium]